MTIVATEIAKLKEETQRSIAKLIAERVVYLEATLATEKEKLADIEDQIRTYKNVDLADKDAVRAILLNGNYHGGPMLMVGGCAVNVNELINSY